jgi:hypothetical protein
MSTGDRLAIPSEIRDAVASWARQWGRHGSIAFNHALKCAVIELSLKEDDPRLKPWKEGKLSHEPKECIPLHFQKPMGDGTKSVHYFPLNLDELGVTGIIEMLNRGNTWSGTGEYRSFKEAAQIMGEHNEKLKAQIKDAAIEEGRLRARDMKRQVFGLPLVSVPDNIGAKANGGS